MERTAILIVAGGSGRRMGSKLPKQFALLGGLPILARTINTFAAALPGSEIVVVLPTDYVDFWRNLAARFEVAAHAVVAGGAERFDSVRNGIAALKSEPELIAVQDGVRPLVEESMIRRIVAAATEQGAVIPVVRVVDSIRKVLSDGSSQPIDRSELRCIQTPQIFRADLLRRAYEAEYKPEFTDDASVVEAAGYRVALVEGERDNLKITTPDDLLLAEALIEARTRKNEQKEDGELL